MTGIDIVGGLLILFVLAGIVYTALSIFSVSRFFSPVKYGGDPALMPVSVIKPLKGADPELIENIRSFCGQDYPEYEVLLGVSEHDEETLAEADRIVRSLPGCDIRVVISSGDIGANRKVSNLQGLFDAAKYQLLAISDSDMRVGPDYLKNIVSEYQRDENTGLVTSLYRISNPQSPGAALESLNIGLDFIPSVVVAGQLEGITFGLGASMLVSKESVESIGGFRELAGYLADDYQLGNKLWMKGAGIVLSDYLIEDVVGRMSLSEHITHQLRWARTIRASRPLGSLGYGITHVLPFSMMLTIVRAADPLSISILCSVIFIRISLAIVLLRKGVLQAGWIKWLILLPVKDCLSFGIWIWSFLGSSVLWRGEKYQILRGGRIKRI